MGERKRVKEIVEQSMLSPGCNRLFIYLCHAVPPSIGYNWRLSLSLALDYSYGCCGGGSGIGSNGCCWVSWRRFPRICWTACWWSRAMFCISLTRERQCGLRKRRRSAPTPALPCLAPVSHHLSLHASLSSARGGGCAAAATAVASSRPGTLHTFATGLARGGRKYFRLCTAQRSAALHGIYLSKFANYCVSCSARKLERGHLLRRPFTFDNCLVGIFLMGSDPVTLPIPHQPPLPLSLLLDRVQPKSILHAGFFMAFEWISPRQRTNWRHALRLCQDDNVKDFTRFGQRQRKFRVAEGWGG